MAIRQRWFPFQLLRPPVCSQHESVSIGEAVGGAGCRFGRLPLLIAVQPEAQDDHRQSRDQSDDTAERLSGHGGALSVLGGPARRAGAIYLRGGDSHAAPRHLLLSFHMILILLILIDGMCRI